MKDIVIERDMQGICPICKKKLDKNSEQETKFITYKHKKVLVCKKHHGVENENKNRLC